VTEETAMSSAKTEAEAAAGPSPILRLLQGAQGTAILTAAIDLGVFQKLADGPLDAPATAERIGCPARTTRILLDALSVQGLLAKEGDEYRLTAMASDHLVPGKPTYFGDMRGIYASDPMWAALPRLAETVRRGGSTEMPEHSFWEQFAQSGWATAVPAATVIDAVLGEWIASKPRCRVLDIAAGSGIYGFTLARHPNVELTCLDWPNVLEKTRGWAERLDVDPGRVTYLPGDLFELEYGEPYDLILASQIYHHFDSTTCAALTKKVAGALVPGGRIAVQDIVYDPSLEKNPGAAMFAVIMLMLTPRGQTWTLADYSRWFADAGLGVPKLHASFVPRSWIVSERT
jgi:2-polyprenyl-3-methyl-5-hydroxy-6-metoxy-1,4-benzoquinol methylase